MRRLDLKPQKKLRGGARYERAFRRDMAKVASWYPHVEACNHMFVNWKVPLYQKVCSPRHGRCEFRREVVETLINTAEAVKNNRPNGAKPSRVGAIIEWPELFGSEICVFFDAEYAHSFDPSVEVTHGRKTFGGGWTETRAPKHDLFADLGIAIPEGFIGGGMVFEEFEDDDGHLWCWERWVALELSEGTAT